MKYRISCKRFGTDEVIKLPKTVATYKEAILLLESLRDLKIKMGNTVSKITDDHFSSLTISHEPDMDYIEIYQIEGFDA